MIIKDKTDPKIEAMKEKAGIKGDVYLIGHLLESVESHNKTFGTHFRSIAKAEEDRIRILEEERLQAEESKEDEEWTTSA